MPTYDYVCRACDHQFEEFQGITAKPLKKCPACAKLKLERLIGTGAGFIFKGSGFYETDYRSEGYKSDRKKDAEAGKGKSDDGKGSKSESSGKADGAGSGSSVGDASSKAAPANKNDTARQKKAAKPSGGSNAQSGVKAKDK